jgi:hypothetical protein
MTLKTVFMTLKPMEAQIIRALLNDNDIVSFMENEFGNLLGAGLQAPMIPILVTVDEAQEEAALKVINDRSNRLPSASPKLSGFTVMSCAACGKKLEMPNGEEAPEECPWCGKPPAGR